MKELLQGRRSGFALRPALANVATGLGLGVLLLDVVSWAGWGVRETNAIVVGSGWVAATTALVTILALAAGFAERADVLEDEQGLARVDVIATALAAVLYVGTTTARALDTGAAAASPLALLLEIAGLIVLVAGSVLSSILYAGREWEEIEDLIPERHRRRRLAAR